MSLSKQIDRKLEAERNWSLRRQLSISNISNHKRLWILACIDERLPVEKALGIGEGDAYIFRNVGGLVTVDAIRSAILTTRFFGTQEIIVIHHSECDMVKASKDLSQVLPDKGIDVEQVDIEPALPNWIKTLTDVDAIALKQVELLKNSPLIPDDVKIHAYIWEVETQSLRRPFECLRDKVNTAAAKSFVETLT